MSSRTTANAFHSEQPAPTNPQEVEKDSEVLREATKTFFPAQTSLQKTDTTQPSSKRIPSQDNPSSVPTATPTQTWRQMMSLTMNEDRVVPLDLYRQSGLTMSPTSEALSDSLMTTSSPNSSPLLLPASMDNSIDTLAKLTVSPQTIPESRPIDHSIDQTLPPPAQLPPPIPINNPDGDNGVGRSTSTRSARTARSTRIVSTSSRRPSRRSTSYNASNSPAHTFLSSWHRDTSADPMPEPKADDEGQAIGLNSEYIIGRTLSAGGFGVVKEVKTMNEATGQQESLAVKIMRKLAVDDEEAEDKAQQGLEHEVSVWRHLVHPHILQLRAVYDTSYATFCVMDMNVGITLFDLVRQQRQLAADDETQSRSISPQLAKHYAYQLASALRYLHEDIRVCHRDVKLENCLVDTTAPDYELNGGNLRLCDFGLADFLHSGFMEGEGPESVFDPDDPTATITSRSIRHTTSSVIGTLEYASPKGLSVSKKLFETAGDVWAYGVVVYALCTGDLPFRHSMPSKVVDAIMHADWDDDALRQASASGVGEEVCQLVRGCLEKDIDLRWTIGDCLASPWFKGMRELDDDEQARSWRA